MTVAQLPGFSLCSPRDTVTGVTGVTGAGEPSPQPQTVPYPPDGGVAFNPAVPARQPRGEGVQATGLPSCLAQNLSIVAVWRMAALVTGP